LLKRYIGMVLHVSLSMIIIWPLKRNGPWLAWVVSLLNLGFIIGVGMLFVLSVTDLLIFFKTIPVSVKVLFALPWIIGLLSLSLPVFLARMWKDINVSWWAKIHYFLAILLAIVTVWLASFWNLML